MKSIALLLALACSASEVDVLLTWDQNNPAELVDRYYVYQTTNLSFPFLSVTNSITNGVRVLLPTNGQFFFYVTASNFWGETGPSNTNNTPVVAGKTANLKIQR